MEAIIREGGNGLAGEGEYVVHGASGQLYRIVSLGSRTHIDDRPGAGNYCYAEVEPADWDDCAEGDESTCTVELTEVV